MKNKIILSLVASVLLTAQLVNAAYVDPRLQNFARQKGVQKARVVALMKNGGAGFVPPQRYNFRAVHQFLNNQTRASWEQIKGLIAQAPQDIAVRQAFWINNSIVADVTPQGLKLLSQIPTIEKIYMNGQIQYIRGVATSPVVRGARLNGAQYPYDLVDIGIDKLMEKRPDLLGTGVRVGLVDTGVDGKHPALAGKIALFYDAATNQVKEPYDADAHGTHTAGTIVGGDRQNTNIGVAPQAQLVASAALGSYEEMLRAMEFMLDPDKNPNTNDRPRLISNSWNSGGAPDQELFYRAISAWEAAGILPVFSAGNSGPGPKTITRPHEHPGVIAVAATGKNGKVADFSSRGPAEYQGKLVQKPDLSAPGVDIISSVPGGGMQAMSGTSMACPHAAGVAALIFQANPNLNPAQVREVMTKTLIFVNENGGPAPTQVWNASYGLGRLNALAAIQIVTGMQNLNRKAMMEQFQPAAAFQNFLGQVQSMASQLSRLNNVSTADLTAPYNTDSRQWLNGSQL